MHYRFASSVIRPSMFKSNHLLLVSQLPSCPCPSVTLREDSWILICNIFLSAKKGRRNPHCNTEAIIWRKKTTKAANQISHTDILLLAAKICSHTTRANQSDSALESHVWMFSWLPNTQMTQKCSLFPHLHFSLYLLSSTQSTSEDQPGARSSASPDYIFFKVRTQNVAQIKHVVCPPGLPSSSENPKSKAIPVFCLWG